MLGVVSPSMFCDHILEYVSWKVMSHSGLHHIRGYVKFGVMSHHTISHSRLYTLSRLRPIAL